MILQRVMAAFSFWAPPPAPPPLFFYANSRKNVKFFALSAFFIIFVSK